MLLCKLRTKLVILIIDICFIQSVLEIFLYFVLLYSQAYVIHHESAEVREYVVSSHNRCDTLTIQLLRPYNMLIQSYYNYRNIQVNKIYKVQ